MEAPGIDGAAASRPYVAARIHRAGIEALNSPKNDLGLAPAPVGRVLNRQRVENQNARNSVSFTSRKTLAHLCLVMLHLD
ncbi:hypothetical protein XH89_35180 [Bradyrhizobium sp. CCBAU 53340]|nr:hypothetical protein XH89_35180 [Bradyrhizobium sp. CCBAU 53340]